MGVAEHFGQTGELPSSENDINVTAKDWMSTGGGADRRDHSSGDIERYLHFLRNNKINASHIPPSLSHHETPKRHL